MSAGLPLRHQWREQVLWSTDERLDAYALAVVMGLHAHMSSEGVCRVGLRRLASLARCSVNTTRRRIAMLEAAGFLGVRVEGRSRATYIAVIPETASSPDGARLAVSPGDTATVSPADTRVVSAGDTAAEPAGSSEASNCVTPAQKCVTGRHTFPLNPMNPIAGAREALRRGRAPVADTASPTDRVRPLAAGMHQHADGTLWVTEDAVEEKARKIGGTRWP